MKKRNYKKYADLHIIHTEQWSGYDLGLKFLGASKAGWNITYQIDNLKIKTEFIPTTGNLDGAVHVLQGDLMFEYDRSFRLRRSV